MTGSEIREKFISFFESKKHARVGSSSLVPMNDPTLFFTNAGMVQFKDVFTGGEKRNYTRATTSQKCMRVSGKHNDLENVGRTPRHHTFFEMLGNFSFGDYFKEDAIAYAWEFLTRVVKIPAEYLWISVFREDDEAEKIWITKVGVPKERIIRLDEKDNFWSMGDTGPCGPCSEIHVDLKQLHGEGIAKGNPGNNDTEFMEIWNLVFMQYDRDSSGKMTPLPKPSIDTGMGLERLCTVLQKKRTNYDTDLFLPIIEAAAKRTGKIYGENAESDVSLRVLADHIRAAVFLVNDGVQPSNEGRGYVLRRIMRRAIRHGRLLGMNGPFFFELVEPLFSIMSTAYPDLLKNKSFILKVIQTEEENFLRTIENGLSMIDDEVKRLSGSGKKVFDGAVAFKLYDTFGFPLDLTQLIAEEKGFTVDMGAFDAEMQAQKQRARAAWKGSGQEKVSALYQQLVREGKITKFLGYETLSADAKILAIIKQGQLVVEASEGDDVEVIVNQTPFYGESGGQSGDKGTIISSGAQLDVDDTQKPVDGVFAHQAHVSLGKIKVGDSVKLSVSLETRKPIMLNHTATHILHAALREALGDHIKQAGSLVEAKRLRFDFSHFEAVTPDQLQKIEQRVNEVIQSNFTVTKEEMAHADAVKKGAMAFFGEKYGDRVRVVTVGPYSMELCGGTHINASGEIGAFKITSESSVASGVRRIEAITGMEAIKNFESLDNQLKTLANALKTTPADLPEKIVKLNDRIKELEKEISKLKTKMASGGASGADYMTQVKEIKGIKFLAVETEIDDAKLLREFSDTVKNRLGSGIAVIGAKSDGKVSLLVTVSKDLVDKYQAGQLIREAAIIVGGKGGGRPDMAQAGGTLPEKLSEAFGKVESLI